MNTPRRRFIRLVTVSATAVGVALASPVVAVADESAAVEAAPIDENSDPPVVEVPTNEPLVIELVVEGDPPTDPGDTGGEQSEEPGGGEAARTETVIEPIVVNSSPMIAALGAGSGEDQAGGTGEEHTGGTGEEHTGGTGEEHTGGTGEEHTGGTGEDHTAEPEKNTPAAEPEIPTG